MGESKKLRPIGRIDLLGTNGKVGESCYYYSEEYFLKAVKEENYHGVPMVVNVYRNEQGQTIPLDFAKDFDPLPQGFEILDYKEGEDMNDFRRLEQLAKQYKALYPKGTRIELIKMGDDDPRPIEPGTRGTVDVVDDLGTIHCRFDNGRRLGLVPEADSFRKLTQDELLDEKSEKLQREYIAKVNKEVIPCIEWVGMKNAYKNGDMAVPTDLLRMLHDKFVETYGTEYIDHDLGMVTVPGLVQAADGNIYPALLDLDVCSSGEHWGTNFFTPRGVFSDSTDDKEVMSEIKKLCPYKYWYTAQLDSDCHVDWDACPEKVKEMLDAAAEPTPTNEVKLE